jgi:DNA-binding transcriptional LysR family regulator
VVSTGKYVIPHFLTAFIKQHQGVELLMDVTNKTRVIESLEKNEIDMALVSIQPERLNVESMELMPNRLFLVGNKDFEGTKKIKLNELNNHTFIYREKGSGTRQSMESFLRMREIKTTRKMELTSNEAVKQAVISGLGLSIMPIIGLRHELKNGELTIIPTPDLPIQTMWQLIWLKGKKHSPVVSSYLEFVKTNKKNIIEEKFNWYQEYI